MRIKNSNGGFTLIELVVVITILGILAAIALPRFAALQADARLAKMTGAMGSVKAAAAMAHATLITRGFPADFSGTPSPAITVEGINVTYTLGYPDAAIVANLAGLTADYVTTGLAGTRVAAADANHTTAPNDCTIAYAAPTGAGLPPTYTLVASLANCQ